MKNWNWNWELYLVPKLVHWLEFEELELELGELNFELELKN